VRDGVPWLLETKWESADTAPKLGECVRRIAKEVSVLGTMSKVRMFG
jgi:hypothetical protein